jgi:hypothetical protein
MPVILPCPSSPHLWGTMPGYATGAIHPIPHLFLKEYALTVGQQ